VTRSERVTSEQRRLQAALRRDLERNREWGAIANAHAKAMNELVAKLESELAVALGKDQG
jgi:hypothetical protein